MAVVLIASLIGLSALRSAQGPVLVAREAHRDVIEKLPLLAPRAPSGSVHDGDEEVGIRSTFVAPDAVGADPVLQDSLPTSLIAAPIISFEGIGVGLGYPGAFPPDANGDVGPNHFVEVVNSAFGVFSKNGQLVFGPALTIAMWQGFAGVCGDIDGGDPIVLYDSLSDRWILSHQAWFKQAADGHQCIAVSRTGDPTGGWFRYQFDYPSHNDYGKLTLWPNAYVLTTGLETTATYNSGPLVCALDRSAMLSGQGATQQCFQAGRAHPMAASLQGSMLPPTGAPVYLVEAPMFGDGLGLYRLKLDWQSPSNSQLSARVSVPVATWSFACAGCVPQPDTSQTLETMGTTVMNRVSYRNFGNRESIFIAHGAEASGVVGIRWYELRVNATGDVSMIQQGTFGPPDANRWMPSIAADKAGNIALAYSVSSSSVYPSIRFAGRLANDPLGVLTLRENNAYPGIASQAQSLRWGDYASMRADPVDDCTFWSTAEYASEAGPGTRITAFQLPGCGPQDSFTLSVTPLLGSLRTGQSISFAVDTTPVTGHAVALDLTAEGLPRGFTANFVPPRVETGATSTLVLTASADATTIGSKTFAVVGTSGSARGIALAHVSVDNSNAPRFGCGTAGEPLVATIAVLLSSLLKRRRR
ncbi:MAG: hypothetical protein E6J78_05445 [Deltaproteobacteria bacterium]|nr:MAG: hypothetical protein E6J78_05445 [Deltaproteobacteria bacterium]